MNNNLDYILGMYIPKKDSVLVNLANNMTIELSCQKCHSNLVLEEPANIAYMYDLAEQNPLTYAKLTLKENGLQDYMDAIEEFIESMMPWSEKIPEYVKIIHKIT